MDIPPSFCLAEINIHMKIKHLSSFFFKNATIFFIGIILLGLIVALLWFL